MRWSPDVRPARESWCDPPRASGSPFLYLVQVLLQRVDLTRLRGDDVPSEGLHNRAGALHQQVVGHHDRHAVMRQRLLHEGSLNGLVVLPNASSRQVTGTRDVHSDSTEPVCRAAEGGAQLAV